MQFPSLEESTWSGRVMRCPTTSYDAGTERYTMPSAWSAPYTAATCFRTSFVLPVWYAVNAEEPDISLSLPPALATTLFIAG